MDIFDDELIADYIEESREHLANIESDLLAVEEQGENIDLDLVNKVFRAAHSIKGGAGFLSLTTVKDLSHKIENVLSLVRNRELAPTPEIINVLLISFDRLRELINNLQESNDADVSELLVSLSRIITPQLPEVPGQDLPLTENVQIVLPNSLEQITASRFDLIQAGKEGNTVFLVEFDLIHDVHRLWRTPHDLIRAIGCCGSLLESMLPLLDVGTLDDEPVDRIPFYALISCARSSVELAAELKVSPERITVVNVAAGPGVDSPCTPSVLYTALSCPLPAADAASCSSAAISAAGPPVMEKPATPEILQASAPVVQAAPAPVVQKAAAPVVQKAPASTGQKTPASLASGSSVPQQAAAEFGVASVVPANDATLRINVSVLDTLMNLAGEMVLGRNQLLQAIARNDAIAIKAAGYRINTVTSELQEAIMLTRMQPIGTIFTRFTRVVRDMARDLGKEIALAINGKEVELDKTIIEGLSDPLTHLVRNAVDHGIESQEKRRAAGKSATGNIQLNAFHEAGMVLIEIRDDGGGIDPEKVARAAVSKGLLTAEQVRSMTDKEKRFLIMMPGFSTAEQVTDISGRGVGMDVVKNNIEKLNGTIEIESELGRGSLFRIKLPLTLAIIPSLFVEAGAQRFAIPQASVVETIRIDAAKVKERIERVGDADVLLLRGAIIPIIRLAEGLGIAPNLDTPKYPGILPPPADSVQGAQAPLTEPDGSPEERRLAPPSDLNLVIVTTGAMQYGVVVQKLFDSEEIVVKPLGRHLKHIQQYAGATIMGDGKVALILDASGLAAASGIDLLASSLQEKKLLQQTREEAESQALLTFCYGSEQQLAVPLELVARVEKIDRSNLETVGGRRVMQYRGNVMPLLMVNDTSKVSGPDENAELVVIVFEVAGREIGLVANTPVDSAECRASIDSVTLRQTGIMGSVILKKRTVMIVDIFEMVETLHPEWFAERRMARIGYDGVNVLLAEDSDFFRAQVRKFMEDEGYRVIACEDGLAAWETLDRQEEPIHLVVTDIEMPRMNGYELTKRVRADARFLKMPVIAVTSLAGDEDVARGREAGVDNYLVKLDREKLLAAIAGLSLSA
jgi:two-component system, chemotaxis family, sensor kinase CheA